MPTSAENKWGYNIDLNADGEWGDYVLDLEAVACTLPFFEMLRGRRACPLAKIVLYPPTKLLVVGRAG